MRLIFRVFVNGVKRFEEQVEGPDDAVEDLLPQLAARHVGMLQEEPGWIEVEFLDEPDRTARFFRIGTDPSGMVLPVELTGFKN